jgi:phosphatidylethanolamine/phosphatidyl-N-methylethanolamine N-methyltransferase
MQSDKKIFWDKISRIYDLFMKKDEKAYIEAVERIRKVIDSDAEVLELATGTGIIGIGVAPFVKSIIATDYSEKMIEQAKKKQAPKNIFFEKQDATNLSYPNNSFDAVIIANALHVIPTPEKVLGEVKRVLKPNAILIAPTFIEHQKSFKAKVSLFITELVGFKPIHVWTLDSYTEFLQANGFTVIIRQIIPCTFPLAYVVAKV